MQADLVRHGGPGRSPLPPNTQHQTLNTKHSNTQPTLLRAWLALVALSLRRQARARQMVWIALALMGFAVALVAVNTAAGRWGMHHWRYPRRVGPTYLQWVDRAQLAYGAFHRQPGAHAVQLAVLGSCRAILDPQTRTLPPGADTDPQVEGTPAQRSTGPVLGASAFQVFSQWALFSIFLTFLLPVWSLSFATEALGGERESHSMIWLLTRP